MDTGTAVLLALLLAGWFVFGRGAGRPAITGATRPLRSGRIRLNIDSHSGDVKAAAAHEAGHAVMIENLHGRVIEMVIFSDGSGYVDGELPRNAPPSHHVAVSLAGGRREGVNPMSARQCRGDRNNIKATLAQVPRREHNQVMREARELMSGFWFSPLNSGRAAAIERRLLRKYAG
jgi:hypothetical protein